SVPPIRRARFLSERRSTRRNTWTPWAEATNPAPPAQSLPPRPRPPPNAPKLRTTATHTRSHRHAPRATTQATTNVTATSGSPGLLQHLVLNRHRDLVPPLCLVRSW